MSDNNSEQQGGVMDTSDLDQLVDTSNMEDSPTGNKYARAEFDNLKDSSSGQGISQPEKMDVNLDMVLDLSVTLSMEVGRTQISIRDLLKLNQGSVIELDRLAGEPLDVMVNGTLVAHGEVVVVNEKFGIYLTDVVDPAERVKKLRS